MSIRGTVLNCEKENEQLKFWSGLSLKRFQLQLCTILWKMVRMQRNYNLFISAGRANENLTS